MLKLLKNGLVIDPKNNISEKRDILIEENKVKEIGKPGEIKKEGAKVYDCDNKWIVPGLIDIHTHLREPGQEWKESIITGQSSATAGGFTSICCMPNTKPVNDTQEITKFIIRRASSKLARVYPIGAITESQKGEKLNSLTELIKAGCVAFSDDGYPAYNAGIMRRALEWCSMYDVPITCHEEDKNISESGSMNESPLSMSLGIKGMNKAAEDVMVARDIELSRLTSAKVHICHISSERGVELVRRAKEDGIRVTAEVTPHHLTLSEDNIVTYDTNYKMSPPLRSKETVQQLREALSKGIIDCIASDHAPHEADSKLVEFERASMGIVGFQTTLPITLDLVKKGVITKERWVESLTERPADIFNLKGGSLSKGELADITVIDPDYKWKFNKEDNYSKSENTPFFDKELEGIAYYVFLDGELVTEKGKLINE